MASNKIYVVSQDNQNNTPNVTIIDGATNTILGMIPLTRPGAFTGEIAANPATGNIYALDWMASTIDVITENAVLPNALQTTIYPLPPIGGLPANATNTTSPTFTFSAPNGLSFSAPMVSAPVTGPLFPGRHDARQLDRQRSLPPDSGNVFTGAASGITPGFHILYAYATDGEDGAAGNSGAYSAQNGPLVGAIVSYGFLGLATDCHDKFLPARFRKHSVGGMSPSPYPILINEGGSPMTYSYTITGPNASEFIVNPSLSSCATSGTLSANSACEIYVTFQPTTTGLATATLTWTDDSLAISNSMQSIGFVGNDAYGPSSAISRRRRAFRRALTRSIYPARFQRQQEISRRAARRSISLLTLQRRTLRLGRMAPSPPHSTRRRYLRRDALSHYLLLSGDGNYSYASNSSTTLTVNPSTPGVTVTMTLLGTGTGFVIDGQNLNCSEAAGVDVGNVFRQLRRQFAGDIHRKPDCADDVRGLGRSLHQLWNKFYLPLNDYLIGKRNRKFHSAGDDRCALVPGGHESSAAGGCL